MSKIFSDYSMNYLKRFYKANKNFSAPFGACALSNSFTIYSCPREGRINFCNRGLITCSEESCPMRTYIKNFKNLIDLIRNLYINVMNVPDNDIYFYKDCLWQFINATYTAFKKEGSVFYSLHSSYPISFSLSTGHDSPKSEMSEWINNIPYNDSGESYVVDEVDDDDDDDDDEEEDGESYEETTKKDIERFKEAANEILATLKEIEEG